MNYASHKHGLKKQMEGHVTRVLGPKWLVKRYYRDWQERMRMQGKKKVLVKCLWLMKP